VLGLQNDADSLRLQLVLEPAGDLGRQPLLDLERAGEVVDDAGELREAEDPLARQIADVGDADERQQVVLAERMERDSPGRRRARRTRRRSGTWSD
jgi:hypothetical protein